MQIKSLEVFLTVVKLGSFSEAAKTLHTVQSNVTSHIKKLEAELGVEILHRKIPSFQLELAYSYMAMQKKLLIFK